MLRSTYFIYIYILYIYITPDAVKGLEEKIA